MAKRIKSEGAMVYLIGLGIPEIKSISRQALDSLKACKTLFVNDPTAKFFSELCPDVRPIGEFGMGWGKDAMSSFTDKIIFEAQRKGPVGIAVYGHPMVYEPLGHFVLQACVQKGISCSVVGGLSTFDAVLSTLKLSLYGDIGVQMSGPGHFLNSKPNLGCYIFVLQACLESKLFEKVISHCLDFYPRTHRVAIVQSANWSPENVSWAPLAKLSKGTKKINLYATLLVPPCSSPVRATVR